MAEQIDLQEVDSGHGGAAGRFGEVPQSETESSGMQEEMHVYIVFQPEVSIEEGIESIEQNVLDGAALFVSRRDVSGNAIVAIVTDRQQEQISKLAEVLSAEEDQKVELHSTEVEETEVKQTEEIDTETEEIESLMKDADFENTNGNSTSYMGSGSYILMIIPAIIVILVIFWKLHKSGNKNKGV